MSEGILEKPRNNGSRQKRRILIPAPLDAQGRLVDPPPADAPASLRVGKWAERGIRRLGDSRVYKTVLVILAMRADGHEDAAIADHLKLSPHTINVYIKRAVASGWVTIQSFIDPRDRCDYILRAKAVRNLDRALDEMTPTGIMTDRATDIAVEVAKGTGLLKNYQVTKGDGATNTNLAFQVNVVMPPDQLPPVPRAGSIGGRPTIDADIMGE